MKKYLLMVLLLSFSFYVYGEVPPYMNVQGFLRSQAGVPVNGTFNMKFSLYDAQTLGNEKWTETHSNVSVEKGLFSVILGKTPFGNVFDNPTLWLEVKIGNDPALPRQQIHSVAYAFKAWKADNATNANSANSATVANSLNCAGCVEATHINNDPQGSGGAINTSHIQDGSIKVKDLNISELDDLYINDDKIDTMTRTLQLNAPSNESAITVRTNQFVVDGVGNVGIGTTTPGANLEVAGQVKITGGTPGAGKVLTSDDAGLASWKPPAGVPSGSIIMYSGAWNFDSTGLGTGPLSGWALCNGKNGTPNLSDRFVMGTTAQANLGYTGGANTYTLTVSQLPSHTHGILSDGNHSHTFYYNNIKYQSSWWGKSAKVLGSNYSWAVSTAGAHNHSGATLSTGSGNSIDNRPSFITLAFIMKL